MFFRLSNKRGCCCICAVYVITRCVVYYRWAPDDMGGGGFNGGGAYRGGPAGGGGFGRPPRNMEQQGQYRYEANSRWESPPAEKQDWTKPGPRNERMEQ